MKIEPLDDYVALKPLEADDVTPGGIVIPDQAKEQPQRGKVLSIGPGRLLDSGERASPQVREGDEVIFARYGGVDIQIDGDEVKLVRESELLAKMSL
ncbi:hypothetical protein LCGC14_3029790, partial [marine sediment metagenome]